MINLCLTNIHENHHACVLFALTLFRMGLFGVAQGLSLSLKSVTRPTIKLDTVTPYLKKIQKNIDESCGTPHEFC